MAGMPSGVAGTLIIRFSRRTAFHSRLASFQRALGVIRKKGKKLPG